MKQPNNAKLYNTALYMRLSRDDENYGDSVSIETQRTILRQYAKEQGLPVVGEYVDDGWSGTNFERPGFQRMMDDVEAGKVNCIVTKDLSRFGREHVMMDYYLEFIFPEKQVRYIAVTENEDTEKGLSDFVPFKNLFNEWFAKDTSRKVKAALHAKFAAGQRTFAYAPLGYKRHPEVKNALAIDEETRWIVEKIFDLAVHGAGAARITRILVNEKVPTPGWINYKRDGTFANIYAGAPEEKAYAWTITQVKSILKDETYIGNSIHNKQTNISYKNKKKVRKPKEEWFRVEDTHEPLVSKEDFARVQELIATRRRQQKDGSTQIFSGLEHLTKPKSDQSGSKGEKSQMDISSAFISDEQAPVSMEPGKGSLNNPAVLSKMRGTVHPTSGNAVLYMSHCARLSAKRKIVPFISVKFLRMTSGSPVQISQGRQMIQHIFQHFAIIHIGGSEADNKRNAIAIRYEMMFASRTTSIYGVGACVFAPLFAWMTEPSIQALLQSIFFVSCKFCRMTW